MTATVTIGVPVFDGARHLDRALRALRAQTFADVEILVVDNASTDATNDIARAHANEDPRVVVHRNPATIPVMRNFGRALDLASGRYFMWAAADDEWAPGFLAALVAELEADPGAAVAMSGIDHRMDDEPETYEPIRFTGPLDPSRRSHLAVALGQASGSVSYFQYIYGLYRTDFLRRAFPRFPIVVGSDGLFTIQVALGTRFRYVDEVLTTRGQSSRSWVEKYPDDELAPRMQHPARELITVAVAVPYLLRSAVIPLRRKLAAVPVVLAVLALRHGRLALGTFLARFRRA